MPSEATADRVFLSEGERVIATLERGVGDSLLENLTFSKERFVLSTERLYHDGLCFGRKTTGKWFGFGRGRVALHLDHITAFSASSSINLFWALVMTGGVGWGVFTLLSGGSPLADPFGFGPSGITPLSERVKDALLGGFLLASIAAIALLLSWRKRFTVVAGEIIVHVSFRALSGGGIRAFETQLGLAIEQERKRLHRVAA